jgi:hypothetical protein
MLEWGISDVLGVDIEMPTEAPDRIDVMGTDFLGMESLRCGVDIIACNPPYRLAEEFVRHVLGGNFLAPGGTAGFLLQSGFLGSKKRRDLFEHHRPRAIYQIVPRPSFTRSHGRPGQTDAREYVWLVWGDVDVTETRYEWLRWER